MAARLDRGAFSVRTQRVPQLTSARSVGMAAWRYDPVGAHNSVVGADQGLCAPSWDLMCRILYRFLALLARLEVCLSLPRRSAGK